MTQASHDPGPFRQARRSCCLLACLVLTLAACSLAGAGVPPPGSGPLPAMGSQGTTTTDPPTSSTSLGPSSSPNLDPSPSPDMAGPSPGIAGPSPHLADPSADGSPAGASGSLAGLDAAGKAALQGVVDASRDRIPSPGLSVAVRLRDGTLWTGVSGDRIVTPKQKVDPDTVFSIASMTKTFVAAAILQLVDEGKLTLEDHLSNWFPGFQNANEITVRELLSHTSGVYNYFANPKYSKQIYTDPNRVWTVDEILALVAGKPSYCAPGTCFWYSNTNFVLLGRIVEMVTGRPLPDVIRDRFLKPLGLTNTVFQPDQPTPTDKANGYQADSAGNYYDQTGSSSVLPTTSMASVAWAAGAMASTASDLATWANALYSGQVLPQYLLDEMFKWQGPDHYGLGTRTEIIAGRRAVGHGGSLTGYEGEMWYFPIEGATIVMLSNRGLFDPSKTVRLLAKALFKHIDVPPPEFPPPSPQPTTQPLVSPSATP